MFEILSTCKGGGYMYCRTEPPHPKQNSNGLYPLHRVVAENSVGRILDQGEMVHHIDGDKANNCLDNLEIMSTSGHARHHANERSKPLVDCECSCGARFSLKKHVYDARISRAKSAQVYCSRSCGKKYS